jgi:hypothetical protein
MRLPAHRARLFILIVIGPVALALLFASAVNAYIDPLWIMPSLGDRPGMRYCVDDERQNKINKMIHGGVSVNSVLIGSSRSAMFDTRFFIGDRVFNLSVKGLRPVEYAEYIRMFAQHVGAPRDIYVGFDFFGYILEQGDGAWVDRAKEKEFASLAPDYRPSRLVDLGNLKQSIKAFVRCTSAAYATIPTYRYDGVRSVSATPHNKASIEEQLKFFRELYKGPVDPNFRDHLARLKRITSGSTIHVYIPPLSAELFQTLMAAGRARDYRDWLGIVVEEFGIWFSDTVQRD